jgi:hypothetical protein
VDPEVYARFSRPALATFAARIGNLRTKAEEYANPVGNLRAMLDEFAR